jgi:Zn-dependent protease with chaperone function
VLTAAAALVGCLLLLATWCPAALARARWVSRAPGLALLLWQAVGLAAGLLALEVAVTVALSPAGDHHLEAAGALVAGTAPALPVWSGVAFAVGVLVLLRLLSVLLASTAATLRSRHRNRVLVDLVATRNPLLARARVVEHAVPLAYCLPGLRPRVVLSSGVLALLSDQEVRAVLAHEAAHVDQRHDLVVLPFVALRATFPVLRAVRTAQTEVGLLVEMLADDRAVRHHPREVLARALYKVGAAQVPAGGLGAAGGSGSVLLRAQRLLHPPPALPLRGKAAVLVLTAAVFALAPLGLLLPMLSW